MPLIRLIFSVLLAICTLVSPAVQAEEQLALGTPSADLPAPLKLSTARNIELELIPDSELAARDLWARIRNGFAMRDLGSPLIAKHEQWYANRPDYVARMTERARRYLYYITAEVERRGMPSEIALLPMIESAFNPAAYSTGRASGIWQFISSTGKNFGMQQNWWYDGRRDVISATNGALDYLQKLHDMFGDWELALAAYNWGEGAVQRAQARNRKRGLPVNYTSLKMPNETRNYVPKLLAIKNIITNPASFGLVLESIPDEPYFAAVSTAKHIDVKLAAQLADISMEEFAALNPAHNRPVILQDNSDLILLPVGAVETFRANLENYDKPLVSWQAYQPKKGERLDHLAPRFGLSVETLKSVNGLSGRAKVSTGQTLLVPISDEESAADGEFTAFNMHLSPTGESAIKHIVRKGDTLGGLAYRYHVSIASLKQWNGPLKTIRVGQAITIVQAATLRSSGRLSKPGNHSHKPAQSNTAKNSALKHLSAVIDSGRHGT
ncbi:MAG TPA: transglycosylase SLT domain-containing protein [Gallionella sp.]|nr:transglycosylase SLT domain-containing protein [Gallionella sp.]